MMTSQTILIVDDEREVLEPITRLLQRKGFTVVTAGSGDEAKVLLDRAEVDWILTDLRMPGETNGLELCQYVRERGDDTPRLIMMSAYPEAVDLQSEIFQNTPFLQKPFSFHELLGLLT